MSTPFFNHNEMVGRLVVEKTDSFARQKDLIRAFLNKISPFISSKETKLDNGYISMLSMYCISHSL